MECADSSVLGRASEEECLLWPLCYGHWYDDNKDVGEGKKEGIVLCQNSWGNQWGPNDKRFFWISYNYIRDWEATEEFLDVEVDGRFKALIAKIFERRGNTC